MIGTMVTISNGMIQFGVFLSPLSCLSLGRGNNYGPRDSQNPKAESLASDLQICFPRSIFNMSLMWDEVHPHFYTSLVKMISKTGAF